MESRGANGVIIVTTKKGTSGKPRVTYDSYIGVKVPSHLPKMMNAQQFAKAYTDDVVSAGGTPDEFTTTEQATIDAGKSTDWVDLITDPVPQTSHVIAVSGGNESTKYYFSGGYLDEKGNVINTDFKRYNLKGSIDSKFNDVVSAGFTSYYTYTDQNTGSFEAVRSAYRARPTGVNLYKDVLNPQENAEIDWNGYAVWMGINDHQVLNPLVEGNSQNYQYENVGSNLLANGYLELTPLKGLRFRSSLSASTSNMRTGDFRGTFTKSQKTTRKPRAEYSTDTYTSYTWDNILNYQLDAGKNHFDISAIQSAFEERRETSDIQVEDLPYNSIWYNVGSAATINGVGSDLTKRTLLSYMGRLNYTWNQQVLFTASGRWDGSSVLAPGHKWAFFPSAALAWRVSNASFMDNANFISNLKLRLSYGIVGNDVVAPYATQAVLIQTPYDFNGSSAYGLGALDTWKPESEMGNE